MTETIAFLDADGISTTLAARYGMTGRLMPPVLVSSQQIPQQDGAVLRSAAYDVRSVVVPIVLRGASRDAYRTTLRALAASLNPKRGDGTLRVTVNGVARDLYCRYVDGMGFAEDLPSDGLPSLLFQAYDPFWYDTTSTTQAFTSGSPQSFFPIPPITLSSSTVFALTSVNNTGDVEAWPVWTVTGPGSGLVLRNLTTGKVLALTRTIAAGEVITIDTRPRVKTVLTAAGVSLFSLLTSRQFWPLDAGVNSIQVELNAATAASRVDLSYLRRFLSA